MDPFKDFILVVRNEESCFEIYDQCMVCQKVKAEHQVPLGLLQPIEYPSGNGTESQWVFWSAYH